MLSTHLRNSLLCTVPVLACLAGAASASVTISASPTSNMNCVGGTCTATGASANLNTSDLQTMLAAGDAKVLTGGGANDIEVVDAIAWVSTKRLTLQAQHSITVDADVAVQGRGMVSLTTNHGGSGGTLTFNTGGKIDFLDLRSDMKINGQSYKLENDIGSLIKQIAKNQSGFYAMSQDFALSGGQYKDSPISGLSGGFDGLGHTISGLRIRSPGTDSVGLVGTNKGLIGHLNISGATIVHGNNAGFVAGDNGGTIDGVTASGNLYAGGALGGIAGVNEGSILNSRGTVGLKKNADQSQVGGVAGNNSGTIDHSRGVLQGKTTENIVGGLVGYAGATSTITNSSATVGSIATSTAGGLVGVNLGAISSCYADGTAESFVDLNSVAGGLVGNNQGNVSNSYSSATVEAMGMDTGGAGGGLVGINTGTVSASYALGTAITGEQNEAGGGLISWDQATGGINFSYWDMDTSNVKNSAQGALQPQNDPGITGVSDAALTSGLPSGFSPSVWAESAGINNGRPYLIANPPQ